MKLANYLMRLRLKFLIFWLVLVAAIAPFGPARADPQDHDAVRLAVERGEAQPLAEILAKVRAKLPGEVAGVEIERKAAAGFTKSALWTAKAVCSKSTSTRAPARSSAIKEK